MCDDETPAQEKNRKRLRPAYRRSKIKEAASICPICGHDDLDYGDSGILDESYTYNWTCPGCDRSGKECHGLVFDEHIVEN